MREFFQAWQIYRSDGIVGALPEPANRRPRPHRLDESATGYSLAGCSPAEPASASPAFRMVGQVTTLCQGPGLKGEEFSTGELGIFHSALTRGPLRLFVRRLHRYYSAVRPLNGVHVRRVA
jgi:hypothetical protein